MGGLSLKHCGGGQRAIASRLGLAALFSVVCVLLSSAVALGGIGAFGADGKATLRLGSAMEHAIAYPETDVYCLSVADSIVRLRPNGKLDGSFGSSGPVPIAWDAHCEFHPDHCAVVDRRGNILVVSSAPAPGEPDGTDLSLQRLRPDGKVDRTFGVRGLVRMDLGLRFDYGTSVALAPHGKILISGTSEAAEETRGGGYSVEMVGRSLSDGRLDKTFSRNGLTTVRIGGVENLAGGPDESVVASGDGELIRLRRGGAPDTSFGEGGGWVRVPSRFELPGADVDYFSADAGTVVSPDGRIPTAGTVSMVGRSDYSVMILRYRANGRLDSSYGSGGAAIAQISGVDTLRVGSRGPAKRERGGGRGRHRPERVRPRRGSRCSCVRTRWAYRPKLRPRRQGPLVDFGEDERVIGLVLQRPGRLVLVGTSWDERRLFRNSLTALAELPLRRR